LIFAARVQRTYHHRRSRQWGCGKYCVAGAATKPSRNPIAAERCERRAKSARLIATKSTSEAAMSTIKIICDARRTGKSELADLHDQSGHHRYYDSSAESGGERIVESRRGKRPRAMNVCGF
jgi:hypothetical protein